MESDRDRGRVPRAPAGPEQPAPQHHPATPAHTGWWIGLLAACWGLPLLLAAGVTAGTGAVLGGVDLLLLGGAVALAIWVVQRRTGAASLTGTSTDANPSSDRCCS